MSLVTHTGPVDLSDSGIFNVPDQRERFGR